jgi:hypothetical protein
MVEISPEFMKIATTLKSIATSEFDSSTNVLHVVRTQLDQYVYEILNNRYGSLFNMYWSSATIPKISDKALVIVERRCHPNLEFCIKNAVYFNPGWSLHIFCSEANLDFVKHICGAQFPNIHIHIVWKGIGTAEQGKLEYNALLRTRSFWETFSEKHLLIFETDCYFLRKMPKEIFEYDYVACKWTWKPTEPGGGGLSYRKTDMMLNICDKYDNPDTKMQDCFVSEGVLLLKYKYPSLEENAAFFTESQIVKKPVGVHQWWTFLIHAPPQNWNTILNDYLTLEV